MASFASGLRLSAIVGLRAATSPKWHRAGLGAVGLPKAACLANELRREVAERANGYSGRLSGAASADA
eukprot:6644765-Alexandrium_andersonii.AAC.1